MAPGAPQLGALETRISVVATVWLLALLERRIRDSRISIG
jgi:hypothetical protein